MLFMLLTAATSDSTGRAEGAGVVADDMTEDAYDRNSEREDGVTEFAADEHEVLSTEAGSSGVNPLDVATEDVSAAADTAV